VAAVSAVRRVTVPGDKSISHRALILAALASGESVLRGVLPSADVRSTSAVLAAMGVNVATQWGNDSALRIVGRGRRGLQQPSGELDCGNSGTTARLMAGVVAGHVVSATFIGDASLSRRPMRRIARPLTRMGAVFRFAADDGLPMTVQGGELRGIEWVSPTASAQVKSAILLAALTSGQSVLVQEPQRSRDHTERMLAACGASVSVNDDGVRLNAVDQLVPLELEVPGDPSSALFLIASAVLRDIEIEVVNVGVNVTRSGAFRVLERMGVTLSFSNERVAAGEPVADIHVAPGARLTGVEIAGDEVPSLIDEIPILACLAAFAEGETRITGAAELRVKESDRIGAVVSNLRAIGADADELPDGMVICGSAKNLGGQIVTHADHRIAMAFGVLGTMGGNAVRVDDPTCVDVSFPGFWEAVTRLGGRG
jgi:3-phosphoshikimate 1-carboxyvinyltransferase